MASSRAARLEAGGEPAATLLPESLRRALGPALGPHLRRGSDLAREQAEARPAPLLPTGTPAFDRLLGGGLPRGELTELVGHRSTGRFSLILAALAAATASGLPVALVDLGDGLDPAAAAAAGVELSRLLWTRPRETRQALAAAEALLGAGFPLVALDLGEPPLRGGRGADPAWRRLARGAAAQENALLVAAPYRVSGTAAAVVVEARTVHPLWDRQSPARWARSAQPAQPDRLAAPTIPSLRSTIPPALAGAAPPLLAGLTGCLELVRYRLAAGVRPERQEKAALRVAAPWNVPGAGDPERDGSGARRSRVRDPHG